jgi:ribosomal protein S8
MINYNIGDLVTRINNSFKAGKGELMVPFSKENYQILTQLTKLGVIVSCTTNNTPLNPHQTIQVVLKDKNSKFNSLGELSGSEKDFFNLCPTSRQELNPTMSLKDKLYNMENGQEKTNI